MRSSEYNDTNLKNKSNVPTPTPPPVTLGTQQNPSVSVPPPPPPSMPTPEQLNQASVAARENSANTTGEKSPVNAASKSSPPKVPKQCIVSTSSVEESPLYKIMQIIR